MYIKKIVGIHLFLPQKSWDHHFVLQTTYTTSIHLHYVETGWIEETGDDYVHALWLVSAKWSCQSNFAMPFRKLKGKSLFNDLMDLPTGRTRLFPKPSSEPLSSCRSQSCASLLLLAEVIQMPPSAPRWVCTLFNEQRKQPAHKWGLEDPLLHIKDTINWGQIRQCARVFVYCWEAWGSLPQILASCMCIHKHFHLPMWNQTRPFCCLFFFTLHNDGNHNVILIIMCWPSATSSTLLSAAVRSFSSLCCVFLGFAV